MKRLAGFYFVLAILLSIVTPMLAASAEQCTASVYQPGDVDVRYGDSGHKYWKMQNGSTNAVRAVDRGPDGGTYFLGPIPLAHPPGNSDWGIYVAKYTPEGTPDTSFGVAGVAVIIPPTGQYFSPTAQLSNFMPNGIVVQPDGRVAISGAYHHFDPMSPEPELRIWGFVARLTANGTLDSSFGVAGFHLVSGDFGTAFGPIEVDSSGNFFVGAAKLVLKFTSNGALDSSFGNGGGVYLENFAGGVMGLYPAPLPNGKVIAAGSYLEASPITYATRLVRLNANGSIDSSFGPQGTGYLSLTATGETDAIQLTPEGKILVTGKRANSNQMFVARVTANGLRDASFGTQGVYRVPILHPTSQVFMGSMSSIDQLADGSVVATGEVCFSPPGSNLCHNRIAVVKLQQSGIPEFDFGDNGVRTYGDEFLAPLGASAIRIKYGRHAVTPEGNLVIVGAVCGPLGGLQIGCSFSDGILLSKVFLECEAARSISGRITLAGEGAPSVAVSAGQHGSTTTDSDGFFTIPGVPFGSNYEVSFSRADTSFSPGLLLGTLFDDENAQVTAACTGGAQARFGNCEMGDGGVSASSGSSSSAGSSSSSSSSIAPPPQGGPGSPTVLNIIQSSTRLTKRYLVVEALIGGAEGAESLQGTIQNRRGKRWTVALRLKGVRSDGAGHYNGRIARKKVRGVRPAHARSLSLAAVSRN